ncbi:FixH family protein [Streptomyces sp. NBC_01314]|nr:FixH family protein [Streptomyces sp. NBC_01314]
MTLAPQQPTHRDDQEDRVTPPRTDCVADFAGGLTFDIDDRGVSDPAHLVLFLRDSDRKVRLPLTPAGNGRLRAALPGSADVPEGRWDAYLQIADGEPCRLSPGLNDLRSLVDRAPAATADRVAVRIPYGTKHGNLTIRSWERSPHAEAGELHIGDAALEVTVRAYGAEPTPEAYAEFTDRQESAPAVRAGLTPDGRGGLRFTVAYGELRPGTWDVWLRPQGESGPRVRVARLLDDIVEKTPVFVYPRKRVETEHGPVEAEPSYTADNDLSVTVVAVS